MEGGDDMALGREGGVKTPLTKETVKTLQTYLAKQTDDVGSVVGLQGLKAGGSRATYDPLTGEVKVTLKFRMATEEQEKASFGSLCGSFDVKPEAYGKTLTLRGEEYRLVGFEIGRSRFPVRTVGPNGKAMLWETKVLDKLPPEWRA